jgi:hypothetical protein
MSSTEPKKKPVGPWRSLHAVIWLIGIAILAWRSWWWPGILVLVAISGLLEAFLQRYAPESYVEEHPAGTSSPAQPSPGDSTPAMANIPPARPVAVPEHRLELLPHVSPNCNGLIHGHEVKWTGPQSADCPYCGSNLPMVKA